MSSSQIQFEGGSLPGGVVLGRVAPSGGIGYDLFGKGIFVFQPEILLASKGGRHKYENPLLPYGGSEVIRRYQYLDIPLLVRLSPPRIRIYFTFGPIVNIPLSMKTESHALNLTDELSSSLIQRFNNTKDANIVLSASGGVGYEWRFLGRAAFLEFRGEAGLTPDFGPPEIFANISNIVGTLFAGFAL